MLIFGMRYEVLLQIANRCSGLQQVAELLQVVVGRLHGLHSRELSWLRLIITIIINQPDLGLKCRVAGILLHHMDCLQTTFYPFLIVCIFHLHAQWGPCVGMWSWGSLRLGCV